VPLRCGRVVVRRLRPGDEAALAELFCDPEVRRFVGGPFDLVTARTRAVQMVADPARGRFVIADRVTDVVVGSGDISRKRGPWEISYQLRRASWGMGLASETVATLLDWFFANTDEDILIAVTQDANDRSARLLERNGAVLATTFKQYGALQRQYEFRRAGRARPPH
jgi:ribosomal-protein-alanine N-acetyltransferase